MDGSATITGELKDVGNRGPASSCYASSGAAYVSTLRGWELHLLPIAWMGVASFFPLPVFVDACTKIDKGRETRMSPKQRRKAYRGC